MATWREDTIQALKNLGGVAHLSEIHKEVEKIRKGKLNNTWTQTVQRELETYSSDSAAFGGKKDIFWDLFLSKSKFNRKKIFDVNLNFFKGSYKYESGGAMKNISENNFDLETMVCSIKFSFIKQYAEIINKMQLKNKIKFLNF